METQPEDAPVEPLPVPASQAEPILVPPEEPKALIEPAQEPVALLPDEASPAKPDQDRAAEVEPGKGPIGGVESTPTNGKPASLDGQTGSAAATAEPASALPEQATPAAAPAIASSPPAPSQATSAAPAEAAPAAPPPTQPEAPDQATEGAALGRQEELETLFKQLTGPPATEEKAGWTREGLEACIAAAEDDLEVLRGAARARMGTRESAYDLELCAKVLLCLGALSRASRRQDFKTA